MAATTTEIVSSPATTTIFAAAGEFPRFDVVAADPSDHFYFKTTKPGSGGKDVYKKIMQEWRLLEKNLPDSIFVRVYETRISLLRAAIVGAPGTPYHDLLFFFDIALPSDYPIHPPQVQYRSFGFRINPNLYDSGKVCLSLLNTWSGNKSEKWDRSRSTILQVLLSIQALVLNEKPYFNEPGYGGSRGKNPWEKAAVEYNQNVFVLGCKSALCLLRSPPRNFEALVAAHFRERAVAILTACDAYRKGLARVGGRVTAVAGGARKLEVSSRIKGMMDKVIEDMVAAFAKNGASVGHFVEQVAAEREAKAKAKEIAAKKKEDMKKKLKGAIRATIMGILETIWVGTGLSKSIGCGTGNRLKEES